MILEVGCGTGRNLPGLLKSGHLVCAVDFDFDAVSTAQSILAEEGKPGKVFFTVGRAERLPYMDSVFDETHCVNVMHWASDAAEFESMWMEAWRVLRSGGIFSASLRTVHRDEKWFQADDSLIEALVAKCNGEWVRRSADSLELSKP